MRFAAIAAVAALMLSGCAVSQKPGQPPFPPPTRVEPGFSSNDCAVLSAVIRQHYTFKPDGKPIWLTLDGAESGSRWQTECDWKRLGNIVYDAGPTPPPELMKLPHLSFQPPRYDAEGALVRTSFTVEPLAGAGYECRVRSGVAGWSVSACTMTWIS